MTAEDSKKELLETIVDKKNPIKNQNQIVDKKRIWKNVIVMGISFMLTYISYFGLATIQSSLHRDEGMGTAGMTSRYVAYALSSLFLSTCIVRLCGHKWTIVISLGSFLFWNLANGFGIWETMIPASIISGLFTAPLWTAQGSYLTKLGLVYAKLANQEMGKVCSMFFGIFFTLYACSSVVGDIITSTLLRSKPVDNTTVLSEEQILEYCGLNDCPWLQYNKTLFEEIPGSVIWTLVGVYAVINIIAMIICVIFLDQLYNLVSMPEQGKIKDEIFQVLLAAIKLMKDYRMWLLVPFNWFSSILQTVRTAEFTGSWVACALGIWMVGYVSLPRSLISPPTSYLTGFISKYTGNIFLALLAAGICFSVALCFLLWSINTADLWVFLILSLGLGLIESILDVLVLSAHGSTFPSRSEASYALYNFFWCICATTTYGYSYVLCSNVKVYIMMTLLFVGTTSYIALEIIKRVDKQKCERLEMKVGNSTGEKEFLETKM